MNAVVGFSQNIYARDAELALSLWTASLLLPPGLSGLRDFSRHHIRRGTAISTRHFMRLRVRKVVGQIGDASSLVDCTAPCGRADSS
jgi:hypothetical protein